jgi:hypothetical protein
VWLTEVGQHSREAEELSCQEAAKVLHRQEEFLSLARLLRSPGTVDIYRKTLGEFPNQNYRAKTRKRRIIAMDKCVVEPSERGLRKNGEEFVFSAKSRQMSQWSGSCNQIC